MKSICCILLCSIFFFSCEKISSIFESGQKAETVQLDRAEEEITRIAEDARNTLSIFFRHVTGTGKGEHSFYVKYPFTVYDEGDVVTEQLWLSGIYFKNGAYYGKLANNPRYLHNMKAGDTVTFSADSVTDWMYIRNGKIIGGYSIKYLLEKIPEDRRSEEQRKMLQMFD
jgi:uncharacterized protein YegJ (DUF2314 family)